MKITPARKKELEAMCLQIETGDIATVCRLSEEGLRLPPHESDYCYAVRRGMALVLANPNQCGLPTPRELAPKRQSARDFLEVV